MFKLKLKALLIHLALSAIVISLIMTLIVLLWFPSPFIGVTNFKGIALILIIIDLVLGPLLTFIVFNPKKKSLHVDLSVIIAIQVLGLSYGLYTLYLTHPVYVTYYKQGFNIITAKEARPDKAILDSLQISKLSSPKLVFMDYDKENNDKLFIEMLDGEGEIETRAEYYEPYDNKHLDDILSNSLDTTKIFSEENMSDASKKFLSKNKNIDDFAFLPLVNGSTNNGILVLDKKTGEPAHLIKTNPWKYVKK